MKENLIEKFNLVADGKMYNRFYHINSIRNFLNNFENLRTEHDKYRAEKLLNEFLDLVIKQDITESKESKRLFLSHIQTLGKIYEQSMPFKLLIDPGTILFLTVILNVMLYFFHAHYLLHSIVSLVGIYFFIKMHIRKKGNNTYGINW